MCEGKGQCNSEKQEVQAKLLLVGEVLPGMSLKHILRTPYALSQSLCQQSSTEELFPRCAVTQAHGSVCTGATQGPWPAPAVGCWDQTRAKSTPSKAHSAPPYREHQCWAPKPHEEGQGTHPSTVRNPPAQPSFYWGFLQTAKFSKLLAENRANQNKHHEHSPTELQAELGRCCHRPLSHSGIALPPPLERPCQQFPKGERNCMACLLHQ